MTASKKIWLYLLATLLLTAGGKTFAATCNSAAAVNNWSVIATWSCGHVPASGDDVVITGGGTTTLDTTPVTVNSLTVNGTLTIGNNATVRAIVVTGNVTVAGTMTIGATAATHTLSIGGNFSNSGTVNLEPTTTRVCNVTFAANGNQTVSGSGSYNFNKITLNMGTSNANVLDMQASFTAVAGFLVITNGTYKHDSPSNVTPWNAAVTIPASGGFWLDNATAVITTTAGINVTVNGGLFKITTGTMTIGNTNSTRLILGPTASTLFEMDGGSLTVTGGISSSTTADPGTFTFAGGTITVQTINGGPVYSFQLGTSTTLNWSGGTFIAANGDGVADDVDIRSAVQNVTGGLLQLGMSGLASVNAISIINGAGGALNLPSILMVPQQAANPTALTLIEVHSTPINVLGGITIGPYANLDPNGGVVMNLGNGANNAVWTNNGTATMGSSTIVMTGAGTASSIGGSAPTTFGGLTINNPNGVTINTTPTVNAAFTLTNGKVLAGANQINLGTAATVVTPSAASYVVGPIQKSYNAGGLALVYPVGDANNYTPVSITAGTTTTAGKLLVSTLTPDHPQITTPIPSTLIDANNDVNRYWRLNNTGLTVGTAISATLTFVATDLDPTATTANFIAQRYDGSVWNNTLVTAANPLSTSIAGSTPLAGGNNDFAVGDPFSGIASVPGRFDAFESSTNANALIGKIYAKLVGTPFSVDVVSINAARTGYGGAVTNVTVTLLDSRDNTGAINANGCRTSWLAVAPITTTLAIPASGRVTLNNISISQAYRDARLQMSAAGGLIGCSTDRFSIRPTGFTSVTSNMTGAPIKTGQNFTLTAITGLAGYDNGSGNSLANPPLVPQIDNGTGPGTSLVIGSPVAGTIGGVFNPASSGTATGASFYYSEVGTIGFSANAIYDNAFTAVDQATDDCASGSFSNTLTAGQYGCNFGNAAIPLTSGFSRFTPDNFNVTANTPAFATACVSGLFTYVGQPFNYSTQPVITVTARNGTNNGLSNATTQNYAGPYMNLTNTSLNVGTLLHPGAYSTQVNRYSVYPALGAATPTLDFTGMPTSATDPAISFPAAGAPTAGVGTLTFSSTGSAAIPGLAFIRAAKSVPFKADIALTLDIVDSDLVAYAGGPVSDPAQFSVGSATSGGGIAFSAGNNMYFGQMQMQNVNGSELLPLRLAVTTQYYSGAAGFVTNTLDNCTVLASNNIGLGDYQANLVAGNTTATIVSPGGTFANGINTINLTAPGAGHNGSLDLMLNLGTVATPPSLNTCRTPALVPATTPAKLAFLRGIQSCSGGAYNQDPTAHTTFGVYNLNPNSIYLRENY